ncbi:M20/M25/M40 family metallo-hydrolase [Metaplanococcus flavidus]|uniref:M20/M25/M40 family metallo-hydrolase n=1 Tax=Metaplanococcus flavidus TaxID=569883 RepID=A0ABW3LDD0_9BACL
MEAKKLFIQLIQAKTVNDDQSEWAGINVLENWMNECGLEYQVFESPQRRPNLVAKLLGTSGDSEKPPLILLSHIDVVAAAEEEWTYPPFSGMEAENAIWGRGTLDTKQLTAMHAHAYYLLSKQKQRSRDVYFIVTSDEENGSTEGMEFLVKEQPHLFEQATVFSEGGGFLIEDQDNETSYMLYANSEKGVATVRLSAKMEGGHAAAPPDESLILILLETTSQIASSIKPAHVNQDLVDFQSKMNGMLESKRDSNDHQDLVQRFVDYMGQPSIKIPDFEIGSSSINVLPAKGEVTLEIRVLPQMTEGQIRDQLNHVVSHPKVLWELTSFEPGYQNTQDDLLIEIFKSTAEDLGFYGEWVPFTALGRTDGRWVADSAASIYGISPTLTNFTEVLKRVHQKDERIEIDSFEFGSKWMDKAVAKICE